MSRYNRKNVKENNNGHAKNSAERNNRRNSGNLKAKDKTVSKMTKDGLVEQNIATGENKRISNRDENFDLRNGITETDVDIFTQDRVSDNAHKMNSKQKRLKIRRQRDILKSHDNQPTKKDIATPSISVFETPIIATQKPIAEIQKPIIKAENHETSTVEPQKTEPQRIELQSTEPQTTEHIPIKRRMVEVNSVTATSTAHKIISRSNKNIDTVDIQSKNSGSKFTHEKQKSKPLNNNRITNVHNSSSRKKALNQPKNNSLDSKANKQQKLVNQNKSDIPVAIPENITTSKLNFTVEDIPTVPVFDDFQQEIDNYSASAYSVFENEVDTAYLIIGEDIDLVDSVFGDNIAVDSKPTLSIPQVEVSDTTNHRSPKGKIGKTACETIYQKRKNPSSTKSNSIRADATSTNPQVEVSATMNHYSPKGKIGEIACETINQTRRSPSSTKSNSIRSDATSTNSTRSKQVRHENSNDKLKQTEVAEQPKKSNKAETKELEQAVNNSKSENTANDVLPSEIVDNDSKSDKSNNSNNADSHDNHDKITTNPKISKLEHRVDKTAEKLDKAKSKLPTKRKIGIERTFDKETNKGKTRLTFHEEVKSQSQHLKGSLPMRPVKLGANMAIANAHSKVFQVEHENVGTKAAHRTELVAEDVVRSALRHQKTSPYKKVAKLERRHTQQSAKLAYKRTLEENPQIKKNPISRMLQKRKIKKGYAKAAREAKKTAIKTQKATTLTGKASKLLITLVKKNPKLVILLVLAFLVVNIVSSLIGMIAGAGSGGIGAIFVSSDLSDEQEIESASLAYSEWEIDLMLDILDIENDSANQGYDEYRYNTGDIGHNPFELMAYLTASNYVFTYGSIESELRSLFEEQYQLTLTPSIEIRYREEETTIINSDGEPETITESIPYDWHVLTITLTARNFTDVVYSRMSDDQRQHYDLLMQTGGQRQIVGNPFDFGWLPYVTSTYGYRIHPISSNRDLHRGIDIGVPLGTEILAGFDGKITFAGTSGGYGNVVVIQADSTNTTLNGLEVKYAHLDTINVTNGQIVEIGDVIGTVGNTGQSTGAHLHLEVLRNGNYLNPIFFVDMGEVDFSNPSNPNFPSNNNPPIPPMNDDMWNALLAEAERHLGKPYVFGANGPNAFDCSSFVSFVLREAGVRDVGRQTAQGLFNLSSSVDGSPQPGDLFFLTGTYSTSNYITHVGFFAGYDTSGRPVGIHAGGSMVQYVYLDTPYYQQHWVGYGRIN